MIQNQYRPILDEDEQIFWEKYVVSNKLKKPQILIFVCILFIIIIYISAIIFWETQNQSTNPNPSIPSNIVLGIIVVFIFVSIPLWIIFLLSCSQLLRVLVTFNCKLSNLKLFEEFYILTNKRWIEKAYSFGLKKVFTDEERVSYKNGIVEISLMQFNVLYTTYRYPKKKNRYVNFFFDWNEKDLEEDSVFAALVSNEEYDDFMSAVNKIFQLENVKNDYISQGDSVNNIQIQ